MRTLANALLLSALTLASASASAHDYWLYPETFTPEAGKDLRFLMLVGDDLFIEQVRPHEPAKTLRLQQHTADGSKAIEGTGDKFGALTATADQAGSMMLSLERAPAEVDLDRETFAHYLEEEGLESLAAKHRVDRDIQREQFDRSLKVLLAVDGASEGDLHNKVVGQKLEIVLLDNPFAVQPGGSLRAKLLLDGAPLPGHRIEALQRTGQKGELTEHSTVTDASGVATFPMDKSGLWIVRSVYLEPCITSAACDDVHWLSHWSAFTFAIGANESAG
jgi:uncharacterized GH25 family protein